MEMALGLGILILIGLGTVVFLQLRKPLPPAENQSLGLLQNQLNSLQERLDNFGQTVTNTLQNSTSSVGRHAT